MNKIDLINVMAVESRLSKADTAKAEILLPARLSRFRRLDRLSLKLASRCATPSNNK